MSEEHTSVGYIRGCCLRLVGCPVRQEEIVRIPSTYDKGIPLCTDTLHHMMSFLDDGDLLELGHTQQEMFYEVRLFAEERGRYPFPNAICYRCYRSKDRCGCEDRSKLAVTLYVLGMMFVLFVGILYPFYT